MTANDSDTLRRAANDFAELAAQVTNGSKPEIEVITITNTGITRDPRCPDLVNKQLARRRKQ